MKRIGTWIILCAAVLATAPTLEAQWYKAGVEWLNSHSDPPTINVAGTWVEKEWKTVILRQKEGSNAVSGTGDGWDIRGRASGAKLYLLFASKGEIAYSAILAPEGDHTLKGSYSKGVISERSRTRPMLLKLTGPVLAMPANYKATGTQTIEVAAFEAKTGIDFGPDYQMALTDELVDQLIQLKRFAQVTRADDPVPNAQPPGIRVTGTITEISEGVRAVRILVGMGAGNGYIRAHVKFINVATGEVKLEKDVEGSMLRGGWGGGDTITAAAGLAKQIAKLAAKDKGSL
jgi:hypothetical protein